MNDIERFRFSLKNAINGIKTALKTQKNLRLHFLTAILVIVLGILFKISLTEFVLLLITICLVVVAEVFNTAMEFTVDLVSPEFNKHAKKAKDVSAGGVLVTAVVAILNGLLIFGPRIIKLLTYK